MTDPRLACPSCHGLGLLIDFTKGAGDHQLFICARCGDSRTLRDWKRETRERWMAFKEVVRELTEEANG